MLNKCVKIFLNLLLHHNKKLLCSIIVLTVFLAYHASFLHFYIDFNTYLSNNNPRIKIYNSMLEDFNNDSSIILFVEGSEDSLRAFAYDIKSVLESFDQLVFNVNIGLPIKFLRKNFLKIIDNDELEYFDKTFSDPNLVPFISNLNSSFDKLYENYHKGEFSIYQEKQIIARLDRIKQFILFQKNIMDENHVLDVGTKAFENMLFGEELNFSSNMNKLFIIVEPNFNINLPLNELIENINNIEKIIQDSAGKYGLSASLVGPLISLQSYYNEFLYKIRNSYKWMIISSVFLVILFYSRYFFISISFLSSFIASIWILGLYSLFNSGIGITHCMAIFISILIIIINCMIINYSFLHQQYRVTDTKIIINNILMRFIPNVIVSITCVGMSLLLICLFYSIGNWKNWILILSIPIFVCILVSLTLPVIMIIIKYPNSNDLFITKSKLGTNNSYYINCIKVILKHRLIIFISIVLLSIYVFYKRTNININLNFIPSLSHNIKNIEKEVINTFGFSPNIIYHIDSNLDTIVSISRNYQKLMPENKIVSISDYLPNKKYDQSRFQYIRQLRRLAQSREIRKKLSSYDLKMYYKEIAQLEANIIELQEFSFLEGKKELYDKTTQLVGSKTDNIIQGVLTPFINLLDTGMTHIKLTYFQNQFASALKKGIIELANNEPLQLDNLPLDAQRRFYNDNNFRINIYPFRSAAYDVLILNNQSYSKANITGLSVIFQEFRDLLVKNGPYVFTYLIIIILGMFYLYNKKIENILVILISFIIASIWFLASLSWLNVSLNIINIWILLILLIIGIYFGMQIILQLAKEVDANFLVYIVKIFIHLFFINIILFYLIPVEDTISSNNIFNMLFLGLLLNYLAYCIIPFLLIRSSK